MRSFRFKLLCGLSFIGGALLFYPRFSPANVQVSVGEAGVVYDEGYYYGNYYYDYPVYSLPYPYRPDLRYRERYRQPYYPARPGYYQERNYYGYGPYGYGNAGRYRSSFGRGGYYRR